MALRSSSFIAATLLFYGGPAVVSASGHDCAGDDKPSPAVQAAVVGCLGMAVANYGGFCGTPIASACDPVVKAGKEAVPLLIVAIKNSRDEKEVPTVRWILSRITGRPLSNSGNALLDIDEVERWWRANCDRDRSAWIVDSLTSGNSETVRLGLQEIRVVNNPQEVPRLLPLLDSPDSYLSRTVLGALWTQFASSAALEKAADVIRAGGRRSEIFVYQAVESRIEPLYPVLLDQLRTARVGTELPDGLIDAVGKLKLSQAVDLLKEWDKDPRITASRAVLISTLTELLQAGYEERLIDHVQAGNRAERRAAAVGLGKVGEPRRALPHLLLALRANDVSGAAEGALWGLLSLVERGLDSEDLPRIATAALNALEQNSGLEAPGVNRVVSDVAFRYLRARGVVAETPKLGWPSDRARVLEAWRKWWKEQGEHGTY